MLEESLDLGLIETDPDGSPALVHRCIPFGIGENGETLVWDPADADADGELQIYLVGAKTLGVTKAGRTLVEFFDIVTSSRIRSVLPGHSPFPRTFVPLQSQEDDRC